jgi:HK97 family phage major capsid protein
MSDILKQLQEQRSELSAQIKTLADSQDDWSAEDRGNWEAVNSQYDNVSSEMEAEKEKLAVESRLAEVAQATDVATFKAKRAGAEPVTAESHNLAFQAWARYQNGIDIEDRHQNACRQVGIDYKAPSFDVTLAQKPVGFRHNGFGRALEARAQSVGTDSAGGYTVPEGFVSELERALLAFGGPRRVGRILRTDSGNDMPWANVDDTGNTGRLLSENAAITETAVTFGSVTLAAYKYSSDSVLVSAELMSDSAFSLASEVGSMLGERIGRITAQHFTTGTGSSQPQGVSVGASAGVTAAGAAAITTDELITLYHSVDPSYRNDPSFGWMMHDDIVLYVRKLKDANDQYLWQPGLQDSEPDRLLGKPVVVNNSMPALATGNVTVLVGAFSKFIIRDAGNIRLFRLEERYRDNDQTGFVAFSRHDSRVIDAGSGPIKKLTQA